MPGVTIRVRWPSGKITADHNHPQWVDLDAVCAEFDSADPNDHMRPWLEENVGRQRWDWDWALLDDDVQENKLTIKLRAGKTRYASCIALKWT